MAYAQLADMIRAFGEAELVTVTTQEGWDREGMDQTMVSDALSVASAEMDDYLRRRYAVPVSNPSRKMVDVCCVLARWVLFRKPHLSPSDAMRADRKDAIAWLTAINSGSITLDGLVPLNTGQDFSRIATRRPGFSGCFL